MTSINAAITDLNNAVDQLTQPQRRGVWRTDRFEYHTVTALWEQLLDADQTRSANSGRRARASTAPADLEVLELRHDITDTIVDALRGHGQTPRASVPSSLRLLAATIAGSGEVDLIGLWAYRVNSWSRQIINALRIGDHARSRRLRGAHCPTCGTRNVTVDIGSGETELAPPLLIEFTDGRIRAVTCSACTATWWRGDQLLELADQLAAGRHATNTAGEGRVA